MKAETLARVHTYNLINKKINIKKIAIKPIKKQVFVAIFLLYYRKIISKMLKKLIIYQMFFLISNKRKNMILIL